MRPQYLDQDSRSSRFPENLTLCLLGQLCLPRKNVHCCSVPCRDPSSGFKRANHHNVDFFSRRPLPSQMATPSIRKLLDDHWYSDTHRLCLVSADKGVSSITRSISLFLRRSFCFVPFHVQGRVFIQRLVRLFRVLSLKGHPVFNSFKSSLNGWPELFLASLDKEPP